jgi:hypothetical protein
MSRGKAWVRSKGACYATEIALEASEGEVVAYSDDEP